MSRPPIRVTHTFAELEVSASTYDEIRAKLEAADYLHAFTDDGMIDMHGIGLSREPDASKNSDTKEGADT